MSKISQLHIPGVDAKELRKIAPIEAKKNNGVRYEVFDWKWVPENKKLGIDGYWKYPELVIYFN